MESLPSTTTRYDAFISYSHADSEFAHSLVRAMRGFFGFRRADALRIFLDSEALTATPGLSAELERHLADSTHLVLLASPSSAASPWVQVELDWWIAHSRLDHLIIVLTDGTIEQAADRAGIDAQRSDALSPRTLHALSPVPDIPLFIDFSAIRRADSGWHLRNDAFHDEVAQLIAAVTDQRKDQVYGQRQQILRRESELLAMRLLSDPPTDPELYILLAIEAVESYAPSARGVFALNEALRASRLRRCLVGHEGRVTSCRYLPDGERVVTTSVDGTARLWSAGTGEQLVMFPHESPVLDAAPSPDGGRLATALENGSAHVWDVADEEHLFTLSGHRQPVSTVAFSPGGDLIVTASEDRTARVWRALDGAHLRTLGSRRYEPRSATFSPSKPAEVVAGGWGFRLLLWDAWTGRRRRKLWGTDGADVSVTRDGVRIATPADERAAIWDLRRRGRDPVVRLAGHSGTVRSVDFAPDGETLITASDDHTVRRWLPEARLPLAEIPIVQGVVKARFAPGGRHVVTACDDGTARIWDLEPSHERVRIAGGERDSRVSFSHDGDRVLVRRPDGSLLLWELSGHLLGELHHHDGSVNSTAFSRDDRLIVSGGDDALTCVWSADDRSLISTRRHGSKVHDVDVSPDGDRVVSALDDGTIEVWAARDGALVGRAAVGGGRVGRAIYSGDGQTIVTVYETRPRATFLEGLAFHDASDGSLRHRVARTAAPIEAAEFSPSGHQIVIASWDGTARIYDPESGRLTVQMAHGHERVGSATFSPDAELLATTPQFGSTLYLWDTNSGEQLAVLDHDEWVASPAFSPDGAFLLVLSSGVAYLWDVEEMAIVDVLHGHERWVRQGCFSPDGRLIMTASEDRTIRVWDNLNAAELVAKARTRVFRELTERERYDYGLSSPDAVVVHARAPSVRGRPSTERAATDDDPGA